jgi:hypothetical protein
MLSRGTAPHAQYRDRRLLLWIGAHASDGLPIACPLTVGGCRYMFRSQSKFRGHLLPIAAT